MDISEYNTIFKVCKSSIGEMQNEILQTCLGGNVLGKHI